MIAGDPAQPDNLFLLTLPPPAFAGAGSGAGDRMIIAPPLVITPDEIDILIARAKKSLDECHAGLRADGLLVAG